MNWFISSCICFVSIVCFGQAPTPINNGKIVESNQLIILDSITTTPQILNEQPTIQSDVTTKKKELKSQKTEQLSAQIAFFNSQFSQTFQSVKTALNQRGPTVAQLQKMKAASDFFALNLPTSFESYFYQYVLHPFDSSSFGLLQEAAKIKPTNEDVRNYLFSHYYLQNEFNLADSLVNEMIADKSITPFQLNYARDLLASCGSSTLIVHGFSDFIPVYYIKQQTENPIQLINLWLLQSENYQKSMNSQQYFPNHEIVNTTFFENYIAKNRSHAYNISLTVPKAYYEKYSSDFVVSGLTIQFTNFIQNDLVFPINTTKINQQLFNSELNAITDTTITDKQLLNYIPFLVTLKNQFAFEKQTFNYQKAQQLILQIGKKTNSIDALKPYLD